MTASRALMMPAPMRMTSRVDGLSACVLPARVKREPSFVVFILRFFRSRCGYTEMGSGLDKEQHARTSSYVPPLHDVEFDCAAILRDRFFDDRHSGPVHGIFVLQPVRGDAGGIQRDETGEISADCGGAVRHCNLLTVDRK